MRLTTAKELFRGLAGRYFAGAKVVFAKQSRAAKVDIPLVTLSFGNVKRPWDSVRYEIDGDTVAAYPSRVSVVVDLFTHGAPVTDGEGKLFAYENTAMDDMLSFADFLGSQYVVDWCNQNDLAITIDGDPQDLTGLVNDNNYEYRSRLNLWLCFTQEAVGYAAVLTEASIQYPTGETDENEKPVYSHNEPRKTTSSTGLLNGSSAEAGKIEPVIIPTTVVTSSGGGSDELAALETGYFTNVNDKEEDQ